MAGSWISFSPTLKSHTVPNSCYSPTLSNPLPANRITSPAPASAPWLLLRANHEGPDDEVIFRFYCCAKDQTYSFYLNEYSAYPRPQLNLGSFNLVELVGSSHGWLAFLDREKRDDLFLSDPTTDNHVKLPPLGAIGEQVHTLILAEEEGDAFLIYGPGRHLARCSPGRSHGWTLFGGGDYESVVYSSTHRRLLCLTSTFKLEAWDVEGESARLDWASQFVIPAHRGPDWKMLSYIVCEEESGEVFVVVRHVNPGRSSLLERGVDSEAVHPLVDGFEAVHPLVDDFEVYKVNKTGNGPLVDFEVYKVNKNGNGKLMRMENSLEGVAMFVGLNHPFAIKDAVGVKPDSIYFGYDKRAYYERFRGCNFGIFDYGKGVLNRSWSSQYINYEVDRPVWLTPRLRSI